MVIKLVIKDNDNKRKMEVLKIFHESYLPPIILFIITIIERLKEQLESQFKSTFFVYYCFK